MSLDGSIDLARVLGLESARAMMNVGSDIHNREDLVYEVTLITMLST